MNASFSNSADRYANLEVHSTFRTGGGALRQLLIARR